MVIRSSRVIKGIGPRMAARIVEHFGSETLAIMEVELEHEDQLFPMPEGITVIREVTHEGFMKNAALARHIPGEEELL